MDWPQVIKNLNARGLTQQQIATRVGTRQSTISDLARGVTKRPGYQLGAALEALLAVTKAKKPSRKEKTVET